MINGAEKEFDSMTIRQGEMDINLKSIYFFLKVVECKSLTNAAEILFVTQPHLSKIMRGLEERLGFELFKHEKNKISLTHRGEEFYKIFCPIVHDIQEGITSVRNLDTPKINIDIQNILDFFKMREFGFINPDFDLDMCEIKYVDIYRILNDINAGTADVAIIEEESVYIFEDCDFVVLGESTNMIVVSPDNNFAKEKAVRLKDIANEKFVFHIAKPYDEYVMRESIKNYCEKRGFDFRNISFTENYQTALLEVIKNKKIAISSNISSMNEGKGLVVVPIEDYKNKIIMVIRKDISEEKRKVAMSCYNKTE